MNKKITIGNIPVIIWGTPSKKVYIYVHGKMSKKESAEEFSRIANSKGYQVISFDLPEHGERIDLDYKCNVWNGIKDLEEIYNFSRNNWEEINLFSCSLGVYLSLLTFIDLYFKKCLFQSPILNMARLINNMFEWFNITKEELKEKKSIETPIDTMSWEYYEFVKRNPINKWNSPTAIIYGTNDNLQKIEVIEEFCNKFKCNLTLGETFEHYFHKENELEFFYKWVEKNI